MPKKDKKLPRSKKARDAALAAEADEEKKKRELLDADPDRRLTAEELGFYIRTGPDAELRSKSQLGKKNREAIFHSERSAGDRAYGWPKEGEIRKSAPSFLGG